MVTESPNTGTAGTTKCCTSCHGDGYFLYDGGPGRFDSWTGNWLPTELRVMCPDCLGTGELFDDAEESQPVPLPSPAVTAQVAMPADDSELPF